MIKSIDMQSGDASVNNYHIYHITIIKSLFYGDGDGDGHWRLEMIIRIRMSSNQAIKQVLRAIIPIIVVPQASSRP